MRLLVLSDTHVPARARDLPAPLWQAIEAADLVVHAGDWVDVGLLDALTARAAMLLGVYGNNDGPAIRARLPEVAWLTIQGVRLAVVHETGPATGREVRCAHRFPDVDLLFFGHSHIPWDSWQATPGAAPASSAAATAGGMRLLNPGSPTDKRRQPVATYLTAQITGGRLTDVSLHDLP